MADENSNTQKRFNSFDEVQVKMKRRRTNSPMGVEIEEESKQTQKDGQEEEADGEEVSLNQPPVVSQSPPETAMVPEIKDGNGDQELKPEEAVDDIPQLEQIAVQESSVNEDQESEVTIPKRTRLNPPCEDADADADAEIKDPHQVMSCSPFNQESNRNQKRRIKLVFKKKNSEEKRRKLNPAMDFEMKEAESMKNQPAVLPQSLPETVVGLEKDGSGEQELEVASPTHTRLNPPCEDDDADADPDAGSKKKLDHEQAKAKEPNLDIKSSAASSSSSHVPSSVYLISAPKKFNMKLKQLKQLNQDYGKKLKGKVTNVSRLVFVEGDEGKILEKPLPDDELLHLEDEILNQDLTGLEPLSPRTRLFEPTDPETATASHLECDVCSKQVDGFGQWIGSNCDHLVCHECLRAYVAENFKANRLTIKCPVGSCCWSLELDTLRGVIQTDVLFRWYTTLKETEALAKLDTLTCVNRLCRAEFIQDKRHDIFERCPPCRYFLCKMCLLPIHFGKTCLEVLMERLKLDKQEKGLSVVFTFGS